MKVSTSAEFAAVGLIGFVGSIYGRELKLYDT